MASFIGGHSDEHPDEAQERPRDRAVGPALFPRLNAAQYRARLARYLYLFMRLIFLALIVAATWWLGISLGTLLTPLLGGITLGYLLNPLVTRIEQRGLSRRIATLACLSSVLILIAIVLLFLLPSLINKFSDWIGRIPEFVDEVQNNWIPWITTQLETHLPASMQSSVQDALHRATNALPRLAQKAGTWGFEAVSSTGKFIFALFNIILIPLFTYYFLMRYGSFKRTIVDWIPQKRRQYYIAILSRMDSAVGHWFRGQLLVAAMVGGLYTVGLGVVFALFGIDYQLGIAIGIASGITNIIPYFGMILAIILTLLAVLLMWPGWVGVLFIVGVFLFNHIMEAYLVGPKILGDSVDLNPITVIILLLAGGELAGIWGVLLAVPLAGAIRVIIPDLRAIYHASTAYQGGAVHQRSADAGENTAHKTRPEPQKNGPNHDKPASPES